MVVGITLLAELCPLTRLEKSILMMQYGIAE